MSFHERLLKFFPPGRPARLWLPALLLFVPFLFWFRLFFKINLFGPDPPPSTAERTLEALVLLGPISTWTALLLYARFLAHRAATRAADGACPNCGYDLRATPTRCPECGEIPLQLPLPHAPTKQLSPTTPRACGRSERLS